MKKEMIYLSTISQDAGDLARKYGIGLEIAEYCTAWNMDDKFPETDSIVRKSCADIQRKVLHAPFNELFPCAIDPKARALAGDRYRQAIDLAKTYGAEKVIIHGGYNPWLYYPIWYVEQSILFWKDFMKNEHGVQIVLENVLEETPEPLLNIVRAVNHPNLRLCLDIGHVNAYSKIDVDTWLTNWAPYLSHFHIHNNHGDRDSHQSLCDGTIPMKEILAKAESLCINPTFTLELMEPEESVRFLLEEKILS